MDDEQTLTAHRNAPLIVVVSSAALLAAMGLLFCWMCPEGREVHPADPHWMFGRMVVGNLTGLLFGGLAAAFGWRRWLKAAPFVCAAWVGLVLYAASLPLVNGSFGWVRIGPVAFCVWEALPLVIGPMAAWVSWKFNLRSFITLLIVAISVSGFFGVKIVTNENRLQRVKTFFRQTGEMPPLDERAKSRCYLQNQSAAMIRESKWIGQTEFDPKVLPCAATAAMPARASALYGKWYLILLCAIFGVMGAGFAMAWTSVAENAKRTLVFALGFSIVGTMVMSFLGCMLITPMLTCGIPWASFGGSMAALHWLALGVLAAALMDKVTPSRELTSRESLAIMAAGILWTVLLSCSICRVQSRTDVHLYGGRECQKATASVPYEI